MAGSVSSRWRFNFAGLCMLVVATCIGVQFVGPFSRLLDSQANQSVLLYWTEQSTSQPTREKSSLSNTIDSVVTQNDALTSSHNQNDFARNQPSSSSNESAESDSAVVVKTNATITSRRHPSIPNPHERFHEVLRNKRVDELREREEDPVSTDEAHNIIGNKLNPNAIHRPLFDLNDADARNETQDDKQRESSMNARQSGLKAVNLFHSRQTSNSATKRRYSQTPFVQGYKTKGGKLPLDTADYLMDVHMWKDVDNGTCVNDGFSKDGGSSSQTASSGGKFVEEEWQHRAPYAILLGAMKSGTHAVTASLWEHPAIAPTGHWELHFFDSPFAIRNDKGIDRKLTLQNYARAFETALAKSNFTKTSYMGTSSGYKEPHEYYAFESSPRYLLNSDRLPDMVLCTVPWVKLIAILRNPIDRAASQYRYLDQVRRKYNNPMVDWDTWINDDLRLLRNAGVLNASTPEEELEAWKTYQRRPNSHMIVGRGLYVIQLEHWFSAMDRIGKPRDEFFILQSENFREDRQGEYSRLLEFLKLPPHRLLNTTDEHATIIHDQSVSMPDHIRSRLQELYLPYNKRLCSLLGWDHCWG